MFPQLRIGGILKPLRVLLSVINDDVRVHIGHPRYLLMSGFSLDELHVPAVNLDFYMMLVCKIEWNTAFGRPLSRMSLLNMRLIVRGKIILPQRELGVYTLLFSHVQLSRQFPRRYVALQQRSPQSPNHSSATVTARTRRNFSKREAGSFAKNRRTVVQKVRGKESVCNRNRFGDMSRSF